MLLVDGGYKHLQTVGYKHADGLKQAHIRSLHSPETVSAGRMRAHIWKL